MATPASISPPVGPLSSQLEDRGALKARLRRVQRVGKLKALALIAPLFVFLLVVFIAPITILLSRSVDNREVPAVLPNTASAIAGWNGNELPSDAVYAAFAADLQTAPRSTIAELAKRLNYYQSGLRSIVLKTARSIATAEGGSSKAKLIGIDEQWGDPTTWRIIKRALPAYTDFYLLASLDLRRDAQGNIGVNTDESAVYGDVIARTFYISLAVTLICLVLGYPLAYLISAQPPQRAGLLLIMVLLPFWTSLLVRTTAWVVLLQGEGVVNTFLRWLGVIDKEHPLALIHNRVGVLIAMTHILLPFMILPIYSVMKSIPPSYMRAASSLGASPVRAFLRVYVPLSMPGVSAGCLLVFILALGYYITPALVGGPHDQMLSYFIAYFANQVTNWGMAAALSAILLGLVLILYAVYSRLVGLDRLKIG
jgi:putative spermidine/putrescine transport system permease protein